MQSVSEDHTAIHRSYLYWEADMLIHAQADLAASSLFNPFFICRQNCCFERYILLELTLVKVRHNTPGTYIMC